MHTLAEGPPTRTPAPTATLKQLAALFLRLGLTAFGGPAAHVAMMHEEVVKRRGWMSAAEFWELSAMTNLIPGPNSTELALHIGWHHKRWRGLWVAGLCFIVPAVVSTIALAWAYVRWGSLPNARWLLAGVQPVIVAIIVHAWWQWLPTATRTRRQQALAAAAVVALGLGVAELAVLAGCALVAMRWLRTATATLSPGPSTEPRNFLPPLAPSPGPSAAPATEPSASNASSRRVGAMLPPLWLPTFATTAVAAPLAELFWTFAKIGAVLFGSGYVLLGYLRAEFVERLHWLTESQLLDAIAAGQITPGPVFSSAAFVGYVVAGHGGAWLATAGIFLPAFAFVAASGPVLPWLRASPTASAALDGLQLASLAVMAVVAAQLAAVTLSSSLGLLVAGGSLYALSKYRVHSTWLLAAGASLGLLIR